MDLKQRKYINNIPRYNLGKMQSSGYQTTINTPDLSSFSATNLYSMTNDVNSQKNSMLPSGLSKVGSYAGIALNIASNFTSAAAQNISKATSMGLGEGATLTGKQAAQALADEGASVATKGVLSTVGKVAGAAGAVYGAYNVANDIIGYSDRITSTDMQGMSSKITQSKNGVNYTSYGGFDAQGVRDYTNALNKSSALNLTLDAAGTGAAIGSIIPGVGTLVGGAIGGLVGGIGGLVGSIFGGKSRKEKVEEAIQNTLTVQNGYNTQAESEAGSEGLRNQFYATHADQGKNQSENGKVGQIGMIHTSHGIVPGIQFGLAGKGESIYNPNDGTASVYDEGLKRVDNIPTGVPLSGFNKGKEWGDTIIFGNKINPLTGNTFAEDAKPYSRILEKQNNNKMTLGKHTELINRKNAQSALNSLANVLMYAANCGKNKFDDGGLITGIAGALSGLGYSIADKVAADKENPYYPNTYQPYSGLMPTRYIVDYTQQLRQQNQANRANLYNINQAGSLSAGQRAALKSQSNLANASALNKIYASQVEKQAEYDKDYDTAMRQIGLANQQYANSAAAAQAAGYAKAVGAKQQLQAQARKNFYTTTRQSIQDFNTYNQYRNMLNLYDRLISNDELAARSRATVTPTVYNNDWLNRLSSSELKTIKKLVRDDNGL